MCLEKWAISRRGVVFGAAGLVAASASHSAALPPLKLGKEITFPNGSAKVPAMLFRRGSALRPLILVAHGDPGFPRYLLEFCERLAMQNYVVLLVDWTYRMPPLPKPGGDMAAWQKVAGSYRNWHGDDLKAGVDWARTGRIADTRHVAAIGFCGGGVIASHYAAGDPALDALVLFHTPVRHHGRFHDPDDPRPDVVDIARKIRAPIQAHFGLNDKTALPADGREMASLLHYVGRKDEFYYYADAGHGFLVSDVPMNAEGTYGYAPASAALASKRALTFLSLHLKSHARKKKAP